MANGEALDLSGFYIVFTSNLGAAELLNLQHSSFTTMERHVLTKAQRSLRPELYARITEKTRLQPPQLRRAARHRQAAHRPRAGPSPRARFRRGRGRISRLIPHPTWLPSAPRRTTLARCGREVSARRGRRRHACGSGCGSRGSLSCVVMSCTCAPSSWIGHAESAYASLLERSPSETINLARELKGILDKHGRWKVHRLPVAKSRLSLARWLTRSQSRPLVWPQSLHLKSSARFRKIFLRRVSRHPLWRGRCPRTPLPSCP